MDVPYAISSVIIKKSMTPDEAMDHALNITKKKKIKMTETKNTYRFRNIPKTKFSDFRSKKINKDITLVFGELKPEFARLQGSGFLDYFRKGYDYIKEKAGDVVDKVKDVFSPRIGYNNATKRMLEQYGDGVITKITAYRKPLSDVLPAVINAISLGKWNQLVKKYGFDKFFHSSLICVVKGEPLNIEKNEVISITKNIPTGEGVESQEIPLNGKSFTLNQMMEKARQDAGDKKFFLYDAGSNNCQNFLSYLLKGQGLYDDTAKSFIYQNIGGIIDELPDYVKKIAVGATDLAATFNKLTGQGKNREQALKDNLHMHFGSRVSKKYMPQISAYKSGFLAGWDLEKYGEAPSEFKGNLVEVWARGYDDGHEAKQRYEEDTESDIVSMDTKGSGRPQIPLPYSSSEGMYQLGFGNNDMEKFMAFLQTKGLKKKPGDTMLKKLYREFKGVKRISGRGFWDDFKRGFNMVFEPASKYVLKPLMALSGTPMGMAGVAGLSALGYGRSGGNMTQAEYNERANRDTQAFSTARDVFNAIPQDMINQAKEGAKEGIKRLAVAGLSDYFNRKKGGNMKGGFKFGALKKLVGLGEPNDLEGGAMSLEDTFKQFGENMKGQYNMVKSTLGLGKSHDVISQFHKWLTLNAHKHPNDTLRTLFKKYSNSK